MQSGGVTHDTRSRRRPLLLVVLAVLLLAAACGSDRDDEPSADDGSTDSTTSSAAASFGDLDSPCGEGEGGDASDVGVTADAIAIGYGDDAGYAAAPGINKEMGEAMEAIIDWCNEQGGINGRTIEGTYYDAAIT